MKLYECYGGEEWTDNANDLQLTSTTIERTESGIRATTNYPSGYTDIGIQIDIPWSAILRLMKGKE